MMVRLLACASVCAAVLVAAGGAAQEPTGEPAPVPSETPSPTRHGDSEQVGALADPAYQAFVRQGVEAQEQGDFASAHEAFASAHAVYPNARALRAMGIASFKAGLFVRALSELEAALVSAQRPLDERLRAGVNDLIVRAKQEVSEVVLLVTPDNSTVTVDDDRAGRPTGSPLVLAPGQHVLRFAAPGHESQTLGIETLRGQRQRMRADLVPEDTGSRLPLALTPRAEPESGERSQPHRVRIIAAWSAVGIAVAAGVGAATTYGMEVWRINQIDDKCRSSMTRSCTAEEKHWYKSHYRLNRLSYARNTTAITCGIALVAALGLVGWDYVANDYRFNVRLSLQSVTLGAQF